MAVGPPAPTSTPQAPERAPAFVRQTSLHFMRGGTEDER